MPTLGTLLDPTVRIILVIIPETLTPLEMNAALIGLESVDSRESTPLDRRRCGDTRIHLCPLSPRSPCRVMRRDLHSQVPRKFGFATYARQTFAIAWTSFRTIAKSCGRTRCSGRPADARGPVDACGHGSPAEFHCSPEPRTSSTDLTAPVADNPRLPWVLIPLLIVFYAGELVWRERDAGLSEITDAMPGPEWAPLPGQVPRTQSRARRVDGAADDDWNARSGADGLFDLEIGLYVRILFGLQLHRLPPLRRARLRGARGGEPEVPRLTSWH